MTAKALEVMPQPIAIKKKLVRDWMATPPITVLPSAFVTEAYQLMKDRQIRRLPVVENGHMVGLVTMGDLREIGAGIDDDQAKKIRVDFAMRTPVYTVLPEDTLRNAAKLMIQHKVSGLPVVSNHVLVGIITESDIFRAFMADEL